jgi:hypothetical protein
MASTTSEHQHQRPDFPRPHNFPRHVNTTIAAGLAEINMKQAACGSRGGAEMYCSSEEGHTTDEGLGLIIFQADKVTSRCVMPDEQPQLNVIQDSKVRYSIQSPAADMCDCAHTPCACMHTLLVRTHLTCACMRTLLVRTHLVHAWTPYLCAHIFMFGLLPYVATPFTGTYLQSYTCKHMFSCPLSVPPPPALPPPPPPLPPLPPRPSPSRPLPQPLTQATAAAPLCT